MDKFFAVFGKLILVLLVLGLVGGGAYYYGQKKESPSSSQTPEETLSAKSSPSPSGTASKKTVEGGVPKSAGLSYDQYTLEVGAEWAVSKDTSSPAYEKLTLSKGAYLLTIMQGATGGAMCLYPGDPDFEGPSSRFTKFVDLTTKDGRNLRRSGTDEPPVGGKTGFTVCMGNSEGAYNQPTVFGHMSYSLPTGYDNAILFEMDAIVSSLKKR